jgi:hypothetical protein
VSCTRRHRRGRHVRVTAVRGVEKGGRGGPAEGEPPPDGRDGGGEVGAARGDKLLAGGEPAGLVGAAHEVVDRLLQVLKGRGGGIGGALLLRSWRRRGRRGRSGRGAVAAAAAAVGLAPRRPV